jgi:hypothetical protein
MRWPTPTYLLVLIAACADSAVPLSPLEIFWSPPETSVAWYYHAEERTVSDNTILSVPKMKNGDAPWWWIRPWWAAQVDDIISKYGEVELKEKRCAAAEECTTEPEKLRAAAEIELQKMEAWGPQRPLTLEVYSLARNIVSEFGDGTAEEQAAVLFTAINRARVDGFQLPSEDLLHRTKHTYGRQLAANVRPVSTRQTPRLSHLLIADFIYNGYLRGEIDDPTNGAYNYLDRTSQDQSRSNAIKAGVSDLPQSGEAVYLDWADGGDYLAWVGHLPNVRPWFLMLMKYRTDLKPLETDTKAEKSAKYKMRIDIRTHGHAAILRRDQAPPPWATVNPKAFVAQLGGSEVPAKSATEQDWGGIAIAGFGAAMGVAIALAAASGGR